MLVIRAGGAGDVLFSTPTLRELKRLFQNSSIGYATSSKLPWLLSGNKNVDEVLTYPLDVELVSKWDHILNLEGVIEGSNDTHAVDLIAKAAGISVDDHSLDYSIPPERLALAEKSIPRDGRARVAIQVKASAGCRTYPPELLTKVVMGLMDLKIQCVLIAEPKSLAIPDSWFPMAVNLGATAKPLRWRIRSQSPPRPTVFSLQILPCTPSGPRLVYPWSAYGARLRLI